MIKKNMKESNRRLGTKRRSLKENTSGISQILVENGIITMDVDDYEEGLVEFVIDWNIDVRGKYRTIQDFIKAVDREQPLGDNTSADSWTYDSYNKTLVTDVLTDRDGIPANNDDIEEWKNGEIDLYNCHIEIPVTLIVERDITEDDADVLGIDFQ